ncbi:MAG: hypothetical protein ACJ8R9_12510 [Steroidobacteraceae bacterium]
MQLARLWREHLAAGCPTELTGVEIAGSDARALDAEITACASALICRKMTVDSRMERRLTEIRTALTDKLAHYGQEDTAEAVPAAYYARLNELVGAVLVESQSGRA